MWSLSRQALEMPDVDPLLVAVPQQLLLFDADRQVFESPKKEKMSTVIDQQDEAAPPPEQIAAMEEKQSPGMRNRMLTSLFSPHSDGECNG